MATMKKCPACGSEHIVINGVMQRKKGLMYYLSGQAASDAGTRTGYKASSKLAGKGACNAECLDCHHEWVEK